MWAAVVHRAASGRKGGKRRLRCDVDVNVDVYYTTFNALVFAVLRNMHIRKNRGEKNKNTKKLSLRSRTLNNNECAPFARTHLYHTHYTCVVDAMYFNSFSHSLRSIMTLVCISVSLCIIRFNQCVSTYTQSHSHSHAYAKRSTHTQVRDQKLLCFDCFVFVQLVYMLWFCARYTQIQ